VFKIAMLFNSS